MCPGWSTILKIVILDIRMETNQKVKFNAGSTNVIESLNVLYNGE